MRYSVVTAALFAGLAIASPVKHSHKHKKDIIYDIITDIVWVTVTEGVPVETATSTAPVVTITDQTTVQAAATTSASSSSSSAVQNAHLGYWPGPPVVPHAPSSSSSLVASSSSSEVPVASVVHVTIQPSTSETPTPVAVPTTSVAPVVESSSSSIVSHVVYEAPSTEAPSSTPVASSTMPVASTSTTNDASAASSTDLITASLYHHNIHRSNHSVADVTWSATLALYAATVASSCVYAHNLTPGGGGYGQNIATYGSTGNVEALGAAHEVAQASTDMWYNGEVNEYLSSYYGLDNPPFDNFDAWGHFSQMVWKGTETIGCASQYCAAGTIFSGFGSWFTVCNYGPEGNMGGQYGANVLQPLGNPTISFSS